ncbi:hypothetical protein SCP_0804300 [Sparassis crispa]|uniref:Uncharacterized protein n=1 Tax=Sparassis crispa TaxID=139825 RepID=A0A401GUM9_9APHY|nr:hypothetical protein SCP_0804300 [Sparassis crispa]GBE85906.1 hypothetical protein SCP_0804300 [Sparassis crispa]
MFNVAWTRHHMTCDHIKRDTPTPTVLPTSPSLTPDILARPELPRHLKTIVPSLDQENQPRKLVRESVGVKEAEERRKERRPEKKVRKQPQRYQEQEWTLCKHNDARGTPAPSPPTALSPCTHLTEHTMMPTASMPQRRSTRMRVAPMMQDVNDAPTTSPAPGALLTWGMHAPWLEEL